MENVKITKFNTKEYVINYIKENFKGKAIGDCSYLADDAKIDIPYIVYDKSVKPQYKIIRESTHDGTLLFTQQVIFKAIEPLLKGQSYYKPEEKQFINAKEIKYIVGDMELKSVFKDIKLHGKTCSGQHDIVTIPVKIEYVA